jgi:hypothetical protein
VKQVAHNRAVPASEGCGNSIAHAAPDPLDNPGHDPPTSNAAFTCAPSSHSPSLQHGGGLQALASSSCTVNSAAATEETSRATSCNGMAQLATDSHGQAATTLQARKASHNGNCRSFMKHEGALKVTVHPSVALGASRNVERESMGPRSGSEAVARLPEIAGEGVAFRGRLGALEGDPAVGSNLSEGNSPQSAAAAAVTYASWPTDDSQWHEGADVAAVARRSRSMHSGHSNAGGEAPKGIGLKGTAAAGQDDGVALSRGAMGKASVGDREASSHTSSGSLECAVEVAVGGGAATSRILAVQHLKRDAGSRDSCAHNGNRAPGETPGENGSSGPHVGASARVSVDSRREDGECVGRGLEGKDAASHASSTALSWSVEDGSSSCEPNGTVRHSKGCDKLHGVQTMRNACMALQNSPGRVASEESIANAVRQV